MKGMLVRPHLLPNLCRHYEEKNLFLLPGTELGFVNHPTKEDPVI
jgi:hypothetical protein